MSKRAPAPTKAALAARPTVASDDVFAGRTFWQRSSDEQEMPEGDNRLRVNYSEKFYVVQLIGSWLHISESAERVVTFKKRLRWVRFESREYELRKAETFKPFVGRFIGMGCYAYVGTKQVDTVKQLNRLVEQPYIDIASSEALKTFQKLQRGTKCS